jgi:glycosyltransferase involved in cell wall biosynthesis
MKVWQIFNRYRESVNGEEHAVLNTHELLTARGVQSRLLFEDSKSVSGFGRKLAAAASGIYSRSAYQRMRNAIRADRPDVVHAHNLLPLFSPAVLKACRDESVPVVITIHSFFLTCPIYIHFRDGQVCDRCRDSSELACLTNNCRSSYLESAAYAFRTWTARTLGLYTKYATAIIALTDFARRRLINYGFAAERISVVTNFSPLEGPPADVTNNHYAAFAGRLNEAKGIDVLLEAAKRTGRPIKIAGTGAERGSGASRYNVEFLGALDRDHMLEFYRNARFVVVPSLWYEMCPLVIVEAMSLGLPVIASRIGGLPELVEEGKTGLLFKTGDPDELAQQMQQLWSDSGLCSKLGAAALHRAQSSYSPDAHFRALNRLYRRVVAA